MMSDDIERISFSEEEIRARVRALGAILCAPSTILFPSIL